MPKKNSSKSKKTIAAQKIEAPVATATESPEPNKGKKAKTPKPPKAAKPPYEKKPSGLDAAAQALKASGGPMRCKDMVEKMLSKGLWMTGARTRSDDLRGHASRDQDERHSRTLQQDRSRVIRVQRRRDERDLNGFSCASPRTSRRFSCPGCLHRPGFLRCDDAPNDRQLDPLHPSTSAEGSAT